MKTNLYPIISSSQAFQLHDMVFNPEINKLDLVMGVNWDYDVEERRNICTIRTLGGGLKKYKSNELQKVGVLILPEINWLLN